MKPVEVSALKNYYQVYNVENQLIGLFRGLRDRVDWKKVMYSIPRNEKDEKKLLPRSVRNRWGRVGIEFAHPNDWAPGLFFGVVLDPTDHGFSPSENGPELCFIVSFGQSFHTKYEEMEEFSELTKEMFELEKKMILNGHVWQFYNHLRDKNVRRKNKWQPLYFKRSLANFIVSNETVETQLTALEIELGYLLDNFFRDCPSFLKLRKSLKNQD